MREKASSPELLALLFSFSFCFGTALVLFFIFIFDGDYRAHIILHPKTSSVGGVVFFVLSLLILLRLAYIGYLSRNKRAIFLDVNVLRIVFYSTAAIVTVVTVVLLAFVPNVNEQSVSRVSYGVSKPHDKISHGNDVCVVNCIERRSFDYSDNLHDSKCRRMDDPELIIGCIVQHAKLRNDFCQWKCK